MDKELSREELFLLVWERPTQEIAQQMGISDVALAKRCKKLQVPKPPPGYWAKIRAGHQPRKPLLKEFSDQLMARQHARAKKLSVKRGSLALASLQCEIFQRAVDELSAAGTELGELEILRDGVRGLSAELATQLLILIQHRYHHWLKERVGGDTVAHASIRSIQSLAAKLLPLTSAHTMILERESEKYVREERGPKIVIRLTREFKQQVANLYQLVRDNNLSYVVWDLDPFEHAWIVQYHHHWDDHSHANSQLCISSDALWVEGVVKHWRYEDFQEDLRTKAIPLSDVAPVELLPKVEIIIPTVVELPKLAISKERIQSFRDAENAYDILSSAVYKHEVPAPDDHLVLLEKVSLGHGTEGPLSAARSACRKLEDDMERWELAMDAEREAICSEALGLVKGDTILTELRGKSVRLQINQMSTYISDGKLNFHIAGRRYRKDGILGKREDSIYLSTVGATASGSSG